ncbi:helix-turn-helix domain-containing protein [Enterococcus faecalis]|uniref:helix-turn-helix domain-containing protein n=1 Tax=Enterococcus faecalis TaxID=1351 RepID=UPI003D1464C3
MEKINRIKEIRKKLGLTLVQLSELSGIPRATLSRYENGKSEPKREVWDTLAKILNVNPSYLIGYSDDPKRLPRDDTLLTDEYRKKEFSEVFFEGAMRTLEQSEIFDNEVLEAMDEILLSLGIFYENSDTKKGVPTKEIIISISKLINHLCFYGVGYEYTDQKTIGFITPLDKSIDEVKKNRKVVLEELNSEIANLFNEIDLSIKQKRDNNQILEIFNVLGFGG